MLIKSLFGLSVAFSLSAFAQNATGPKPTFQFTQLPGGYVVTQPVGPNLSRNPVPVNITGQFTSSRPMTGGKHFTASSGSAGVRSFDQSGVFDIRTPTGSTAGSIRVAQTFPATALVKTIARSLPGIATAIAIQQIIPELLRMANESKDPNDVDPIVHTDADGIHQVKPSSGWRNPRESKLYASPSAACNASILLQAGNSSGYAVPDHSPDFYTCAYVVPATVNTPSRIAGADYALRVVNPPVRTPYDFDRFDLLPETSLPPNSILEPAINVIPQRDIFTSPQTPSVTIDAQPLPVTQTVTKPNGDTVTTTTTTNVTVNNNNSVVINSNTTVVTRTPIGTIIPNDPLDAPTNTPTPNPNSEPPPIGPVVDTPFPSIPKLYEPVYPDGISGVWDDKKSELEQTSLFTVLPALLPSLGDGGCPSWSLPSFYGGSLDASIPCSVWVFLRLVIIITALLLARRLIFGG